MLAPETMEFLFGSRRQALISPGYHAPFAFRPIRKGSRLWFFDDYRESSVPAAIQMLLWFLVILSTPLLLWEIFSGGLSCLTSRTFYVFVLTEAVCIWILATDVAHSKQLLDRFRVLCVDTSASVAIDLVVKRGSGLLERIDIAGLEQAGPFQSEVDAQAVSGWPTIYFRFSDAAWLTIVAKDEAAVRAFASMLKANGLSIRGGEKIVGPSKYAPWTWRTVAIDQLLAKADRTIESSDLISQADLAVLNAAVDKIIRDAKAGVSYAVPTSGPLPSS